MINTPYNKKGDVIKIPRRLDLTGNTYGDFTVIEMLYGYRYISGKPRTYCKCIGIDEKEYIIRADALNRGITKHIGERTGKPNCLKDVYNQRFGLLTALYPMNKRSKNGCVIWHCRCDCGNDTEVSVGDLLRGHTLSCGCRHRSKWEIFIENYLNTLNINYKTEYRFKDCTNSKGSDTLPFDFYIEELKVIIEYDGLHHYEPVTGWGGEEKFQITQENDKIKNKYCKDKGIRLLRIPYFYDENKIKEVINQFITRNDHSLLSN